MPPKKDNESSLSPEIARLSAQIGKNPQSKLFIPLAEEYMKAGMVEEAVMTLEEGLKVHPAYMSARVLLGKAYFEKGDTANACAQFEMVVKAVPDNLYVNRKLGDIYKSQGRREESIKAYRMVSILNPKDEEVVQILEELESGATPAAPSSAPPEKMTVESHRAEEAPVKQPVYTPPPQPEAAPEALPEAAPEALDEETEGQGSKVYDLSETEDTGLLDVARGGEPEPDYAIPEQPSFMEMPVPEMETLQQVKQAQPPVDDAPSGIAEAAGESARPTDFVSAVEGSETPVEAPAFLEEAVSLEAAEPFEAQAGPVDFMSVVEEPGPGAINELTKGKPGGYAVDLSMMKESGLDDIFSTDNAAPAEEEVSVPAADSVYEIGEDVSVSDISGLKIESPVIEKKEKPQAEGAPAKDAFETETLAELYISQGFYDRAITIYKNLLMVQPGNMALKQKLEDLYLLAELSTAKAAPKADEAKEPCQAYRPVDFDVLAEEPGVFETEPAEVDTGASRAEPFEARTPAPMDEGPATKAPQVDAEAVRRLEMFLDNIRRKGNR